MAGLLGVVKAEWKQWVLRLCLKVAEWLAVYWIVVHRMGLRLRNDLYCGVKLYSLTWMGDMCVHGCAASVGAICDWCRSSVLSADYFTFSTIPPSRRQLFARSLPCSPFSSVRLVTHSRSSGTALFCDLTALTLHGCGAVTAESCENDATAVLCQFLWMRRTCDYT